MRAQKPDGLAFLAAKQYGVVSRAHEFLRLCRRYGIPAPEAQVRAGRRRPDFVWREARLVVEVHLWSGHGNPVAFQADRALTNTVQLAGWRILRFTWADVTRRPDHVAAQLQRALGL